MIELSEEHTLLQETIRRFAQDTVLPRAHAMDDHGELDSAVLDGMRELGLFGLTLPDSGVAGQPMEKDGVTTWRRVDLAALRARLPYPVAGYYILQTPDSALPKLPRRDAAPAFDEGAHLSYAIQWFSFAITALVVGGIVGFRREREGGAPGPG